MIWMTWRQFRTQASFVFAAIVALVSVLAVTGVGLLDTWNADKRGFLAEIQFNGFDRALYNVGLVALYVAPPLIGAFWGAPLVARELETGTHRLVWNQSITRTRWLANKLAFTGLAAAAAVGLLSLAVLWWSSPIDREIGNGNGAGTFRTPWLSPVVFGARGIVPVGYTVFAFALGVTVGLVLRRSVLAIAVTLVGVVAVQVAMPLAVRAHLAAPVKETVKITASNLKGLQVRGNPATGLPTGPVRHLTVKAGAPGDWVLSNRTVDASGRVRDSLPNTFACVPAQFRKTGVDTCFTRLAAAGYRQELTYQPASRFWSLQWRETAVLLTLAVLLTGFCFRRIRRDLS